MYLFAVVTILFLASSVWAHPLSDSEEQKLDEEEHAQFLKIKDAFDAQCKCTDDQYCVKTAELKFHCTSLVKKYSKAEASSIESRRNGECTDSNHLWIQQFSTFEAKNSKSPAERKTIAYCNWTY